MSTRLIFILIGVVLVAGLGTAALLFSIPKPRAPKDLPGDPTGPARQLVDRHLSRITWFRRVGAFFGLVLAIEVGAIWYSRVGVSTGETGLFADVLAMPMLGSLAGAIAAETYNLRRRYRGARIVDLSDRRGRYRLESNARRFRIWAALAIITTVIAALGQASILLPLVAVVTLAAVETWVRFVELRARPALPSNLAEADDLIRRWATERLDRSGYGIAVLLTGWGLIGALDPLNSIALATLVGWTTLIVSFSIWRSVGRIPV
ncbi:MAG: hypothetical protein WA726_01295 [Acidimicrobiia bacterium]